MTTWGRDEIRQLFQLMCAAEAYLLRASKSIWGREDLPQWSTQFDYMPGYTPNDEAHQRLLLGADLASAAIRLWTIEEVLGGRHFKEIRSYFNGDDTPNRKDLRNEATRDNWLHAMLRDNVCHAETHRPDDPIAKWKLKKRRWQARRIALESLSFEVTLQTLHKIARLLRRRLVNLGHVPPRKRGEKLPRRFIFG